MKVLSPTSVAAMLIAGAGFAPLHAQNLFSPPAPNNAACADGQEYTGRDRYRFTIENGQPQLSPPSSPHKEGQD